MAKVKRLRGSRWFSFSLFIAVKREGTGNQRKTILLKHWPNKTVIPKLRAATDDDI